jgi:hypothetical protein
MWPWALVAFFAWLFAQFPIGYFFNDFVMGSDAVLVPWLGLILGLLALSALSGYARDLCDG